MSRSSFARSFDAFSWKRLVDPTELTNASTLGAIISIGGGLLLMFLVVAETLAWATPHLNTEVGLDDAGNNKPLRITLNLTFPHMPCDLLSIEVTDALGSRNTNLSSSNLHKITIDAATGRALMVKKEEGINNGGRGRRGFFARLLGLSDGSDQRRARRPSLLDDPDAPEFATRLDIDSFPQFIADNDVALVAFSAHWCPWSRKLAPVWEQVAEVVSSVPDVKLGKVDCASDGASQLLCLQQHIAAFPTILLFKGHSPHSHVHYHGERTQQAILDFLVAARQDETLTTDPRNPQTLEAHAAAERLARDVQLLEHPEGEHGHDHGKPAEGQQQQPPAQQQQQTAEGEGNAPKPAPGAGEQLPNLDPAHPGAAQALIEAIHTKGLHAPGDAARALLSAIAGKGKAGEAAKGTDTEGGGLARMLAKAQNGMRAAAQQPPAPPRFGCQLAGYLDFKRVPTSLVISPNLEGKSADYSTLNLSHVVHSLFFGPKLTRYQLQRLNAAAIAAGASSSNAVGGSAIGGTVVGGGTGVGGPFSSANLDRLKNGQFSSPSWNTSHEHYLSVVANRFTFLNGHQAESYAYSAASSAFEEGGSGEALEAFNQQKARLMEEVANTNAAAAAAAAAAAEAQPAATAPAEGGGDAPAPAALTPSPTALAALSVEHQQHPVPVPHPQVKFSFAINPLSLYTREKRQPFYRWLTSLCAIIGGVVVVILLLDSLLHSIRGKASVKRGLNKLS